MVKFRPVRGMRDILYPESVELDYLFTLFKSIVEKYGYKYVITPTIELFELFALKSGEEIKRSMYVFRDKAGREVALRPEVTASIARLYINSLIGKPKPVRLYYISNVFRYEEPQFGRYREFYQAGIELLGIKDPLADAETILVLKEYYDSLGIKYRIKLGHVGVIRNILAYENVGEEVQDHILWLIDKGRFDDAVEVVTEHASNKERVVSVMEKLAKTRVESKAELKVISNIMEDLRVNGYTDAAEELDYLVRVADILYEANVPFYIDLGFARGLAYYTGIIYEVVSGLKVSIAGGGRYDTLIKLYGGPPTPAVGFAIGIDRTLLALKSEGIRLPIGEEGKVLIVGLVEEAKPVIAKIILNLHREGIKASISYYTNLKKALSYASENKYNYVVIVGREELKDNKVTLRDMESRVQEKISVEELVEKVKRKLVG
ncbi:MAG TPA: histidine--tRNA ligase [Desulfurococcales archaeon]|nr:histidine--tRNA ligase [Desulfurococcales archaeon]